MDFINFFSINWNKKNIIFNICLITLYFYFQEPQSLNAEFSFNELTNRKNENISDGKNYLTEDQFLWGETQLKRMLMDRPVMSPYVRKGDDLWLWMVRQFAGECVEGGIWWDARDPKPLWDAMYYGAWEGKKAHIQVTENFCMYKEYFLGEPKTAPVLWYEVFFEIFNLITLKPIYELNALASRGKVEKENYILRRMMAERQTGEAAHDFYHKVWIPHCKKMSLPYEDEYLVKIYGKGIKVLSREEVLETKFNPNNFNYRYFANQYEALGGNFK